MSLPDPKKEGKEYRKTATMWAVKMDKSFTVDTLEGRMSGQPGDYLCEGPAGERWPQKAEILEANYEPVAKLSPQLGLKGWDQLEDPYDSEQLAKNWEKLDAHDCVPPEGTVEFVDKHDMKPGRGVHIPRDGEQ